MADRTISLESDGSGSKTKGGFSRSPPLLLVFLALLFVSLLIVSNVAINFHISTYGRREGVAAIIALTAVIAGAFVVSKFSFGYLVGFYLFTMMAGYFWFNIFGTLGYDRGTALMSATASIICFLVPVLLITKPARQFLTLPHAVLDALPPCILVLSALVFLLSALNGIHLVGLAEIYQYRGTLNHSPFFDYFIGIFCGALLPFAFACLLARKRWLLMAALCAVSMLFFTVTFTKLSLLVSLLLIFVAFLSAYFEPRAAVILSLLVPMAIGLLARTVDSGFTNPIFGLVSFRLLAIPSISLDHCRVGGGAH